MLEATWNPCNFITLGFLESQKQSGINVIYLPPGQLSPEMNYRTQSDLMRHDQLEDTPLRRMLKAREQPHRVLLPRALERAD